MFQPQLNGCRGRLRALRPGALPRLHSVAAAVAPGLFGRVCDRARAQRAGAATVARQKRAKRSGQCFLQLSLWRVVGGGGGGRVVHTAFAVPDLLHGGVRARIFCLRLLARSRGEEIWLA